MSESEGKDTDPRSDQRVDPRFPIKAAITFFPFSSRGSYHYSATALNCSRFGLYFESPLPLKIGQYICIRMQQVFEDRTSGQARHLKTLTLAQVRWCETLGGKIEPRYAVGVRYC